MYLMCNGVTQATPLFRCLISSGNLTGAFIDCVTDLRYTAVKSRNYFKLVKCGAPLDALDDDIDLFLFVHVVSGVG